MLTSQPGEPEGWNGHHCLKNIYIVRSLSGLQVEVKKASRVQRRGSAEDRIEAFTTFKSQGKVQHDNISRSRRTQQRT